jgi:hypothetical protein
MHTKKQVPAPTAAELQTLVQTISERIGRRLERPGRAMNVKSAVFKHGIVLPTVYLSVRTESSNTVYLAF